jgi:hypothetical protein
MISYTGNATESEATILIFGDGASKSVTIDLTKAPFGVKFIPNPARAVGFVYAEDQSELDTVDFVQGKVVITFVDAPGETNFDYAEGQVGVPRTRVELYFVYEPAPESR